ncbi:hypothetical protein IMCC3317_47570 [Kordia antarctica]|uniref:Uncharacterized protein n=1 Tax=Kordia antarctica TaxID=1218801 RepID=A0A7L4ZSC5_9FLAO|nr:class I lanthipeptide [Kordia antarctica]QHI39347.1 hypothetical protein IMCC3317_47570 [Kordia antarctica]
MKKKNFNSKLSLKKAQIADLNIQKATGGLAKDTLQRGCVSYPYRCSIQECDYTDVTCYHTETCQPKN